MRYNDPLREIPGVGVAIAKDLRRLGINVIRDLKGRDPQQLYDQLQTIQGGYVDRCMLYVMRCAVYYASHKTHDPDKLLWWNWKDQKTKHS